jgi:CheY-like chemotaxis protein
MGRCRVLIVEDHADLRRLYAVGLNQRGFEVRLAANGAEAIDRIEETRPHVLVLDLCMPIMDGWEVIERLATSATPDIPVVVVSGYSQPEGRTIPPVVRGWLAKPATIDELARTLESISPLADAC